jgi:hypothetical protein
MAHHAIAADGDIECADYERDGRGVERDDDGSFVAFVPCVSLVAPYDEEALPTDERPIA